MAYVKKVWKSTQGSGLNKFRIGNLGVYPLVSTPDEVTVEGDILSADNFNNFESRIEDAFNSVDNEKACKSTTVNGKSLSSDIVLNAVDVPFDNSSTTLVSTNVKDAIIETFQIGGAVFEQWVKDWVKAHSIESYPTLPSPQDISNGKAIWDETGKRLLTPNGNEFVELLPAIRKVNEIVNTGNENIFYKKTGGIFYEGASVDNPLKNPVFYKIIDHENFTVLDLGVRIGENSYTWESVDNTYISAWANSGYIASCTHLDPEAEIWGGMDDSTWIYNSVEYGGATITDDELVYIDSFGLIKQVTDDSKIGDLSNLHTTDKSNLVNAINEINNNIIIDVTELPTTNINKNVLYRIVGTGGSYTALYFYDDKDNNFKSIPSMEYLAYAFGAAFQSIDAAYQTININLNSVKKAVAFEWIKGAGGSGINVDSCIFNLISNYVIGTNTQPIVKKESFVCNFTDPVTNSNTYGECETTQYFIRHLIGRVNYIVFQQVVTKYVQNASNTIKMMRRGSYVIPDENFNYFTDVTNLTSTDITWTSWSLIDYPKTNLTLSNTTDFSVDTFCFTVSGRNVTIFISDLRKLVESPSSDIFAIIPDYLKSANGFGAHAMLADSDTFNTFATLSKVDSTNSLLLRGAVTNARYCGSISYGIGY